MNVKRLEFVLTEKCNSRCAHCQGAHSPEREWDLTERISYHFNLPFMNCDIVDEILLLAEQLMEISKEKGLNIEKAKMEYEKARDLINQDRKSESVKHAVKA